LVGRSSEGEQAVQSLVVDRLHDLGCAVERLSYWPRALSVPFELSLPETVAPGEHLNVVGKLSGDGGGRSLLLFAHPDSEPVIDLEAWQYDPYGGTIDRGRIHGCGIADDLVGVAIMVAALDVLRTAGISLLGDVTLASTISKRRAQGIINVLDHGYEADASLYLHPAESGVGLGEIKGITQGLLSFRVTVRGRVPETTEPTHTPFLHLAVSPLEKMLVIYQALSQLAEKRVQQVSYPPLEEAVGRSTNLNLASIHYGDSSLPTRVSDTCVLSGSLTFPPTESLAQVHDQLVAAIHGAAAADP
jgi:acetylornithine deacetylase